MNIICADFILTCDDNFNILYNGAVCFDKKIIEVGERENILNKYKNAAVTNMPKNSILMPGLINTHTHLEFSDNIATLTYGSFIPWLKSVIQNREILREKFNTSYIKSLLDSLFKSGTTTLGNISSFGVDLEACLEAKQKIVYFVEAIGSTPDALDALYSDFQARAHEALSNKNEKFIPAFSVHSPYSTHPIMAKKVIEFAKEEALTVSAHFMESLAERDWIDSGSGEFREFFNLFNSNIKPMYKNGVEFLEMFKGVKTLLTHCVHINNKELDFIKELDVNITHCPSSNRLLGSGELSLELLDKNSVMLSMGTDGLSSNTTLNLWDEMRNALYIHPNYNLNDLSQKLLLSATNKGAKALNLTTGQITKGFDSDMISFCLKEVPKDMVNLPLQIILQTNSVSKIYINGQKYL